MVLLSNIHQHWQGFEVSRQLRIEVTDLLDGSLVVLFGQKLFKVQNEDVHRRNLYDDLLILLSKFVAFLLEHLVEVYLLLVSLDLFFT